ncbi:YciI family protein [Actinomadura napierensis]|uniref:YciI family protein n=1 Tax=Actinomadura napierensis TaxID=267854 RepID=A0ABP5JLF0_9ACTN
MKHYLLSIQQPDGGPPAPEVLEPIMRDVAAFNQELRDAEAWVFAGGLHLPHAAAVAHPQADDVLITDGPYTEGKEHVGGLSIIKAPDLDSALEWARKLARATTLPIEVREFQGTPPDHLP